jgi:hypothetical protein
MKMKVQTFATRRQATERIKQIQATFIRPEKMYDPEDANADKTGHVWIISMSGEPDSDKLYLCENGYIR